VADDASYSSLTVAGKRLNHSGEWHIVGTGIYCGHECGSVCVVHRQTDWDAFMTSLMDSLFYHQQFIREDTVSSIFAGCCIVTIVDRSSVGFHLMVSSRRISWGMELNLTELRLGRGRRSSLHEPTNRPRVPLSYSFYVYEQSSRDDPPWV
jgi:hypothetical protein